MIKQYWLLLPLLILGACTTSSNYDGSPQTISSPDGRLELVVTLNEARQVQYQLNSSTQLLINTSTLGFEFINQPDLAENLTITRKNIKTVDQSWQMPWGEQEEVRDHYNEMKLDFKEKSEPYREFSVVWRLYDDGLGFRYEFPQQSNGQEALIKAENTEFNLIQNPTCWWIPGDWDSYEHLYNTTNFKEIDALSKRNHPNLYATYIPENAVHTPFTWKTSRGLYASIHEANLTNYPAMTLRVDTAQISLSSSLVGIDNQEYKAKVSLPFNTPWRTVQFAENAGDLIESKLILNLNEPNQLANAADFKPAKFVGIWWELLLDKSTWAYETDRHGATTENSKKYIDFAAANGIDAVLIEGWNHGWQRWLGFKDREGVFDFVTPYPDFDLAEVAQYAQEKSVQLIMHNETAAAPRTYEDRLDKAFELMEKYGYRYLKTGYTGPILPEGEHHHGQWMVNHHRKVLEKAAEMGIALMVNEPIKPTGLRRIFPNLFTSEGVRGQEFNNFSIENGNPPEHLSIVPFTRMLAGPVSYNPGIFNIKLEPYRPDNQVNTTLAHQLAAYVVIYSPMQMAADLIENYEGHPAFKFIQEVGIDWTQSKVLDGEIGDFITVAREERGTGNWFLGSITDENPRNLKVKLDFLADSTNYLATIYADTEESHWNTNPTAYKIEQRVVDATTELEVFLAAGGGMAMSIIRE